MEKMIDEIWAYIPTLLEAVAVLAAGWWLISFLRKGLKKALKKTKLDPSAHKLIVQIAVILLRIILFIMVLGQLGVNTTSVITMIGAAGLAVSLALQSSLSNLAGGVLILISHPFGKGDYIEANGVSGTVDNISLWNTRLFTPDNKSIYIPNGELSGAKVTNYSSQSERRLDIVVPIGYGDDVVVVKDVLAQILAENPLALASPDPVIGVANFGASAVEMVVKVWVKTDDYWNLHYQLHERIKQCFDEKGISIPYQQMDIHVKGENK